MSNLQPLKRLLNRVADCLESDPHRYFIPGRWIHHKNNPQRVAVHAPSWWHNTIQSILNQPAQPLDHPNTVNGNWSRYATIYNIFVRSSLAFDHNGDGELDRPNSDGYVETGTFVKAICLLPYIKSLGCNTIHLLPITTIGQDGNKGDSGSPYAIRNPYQLDKNLAEPLLKLGIEAEYKAFVSAAHHLGLRVVQEFVFRTASKDADMVKTNPEWFYWINADVSDRQPDSLDESAYGMPIFSQSEAHSINSKVEAGNFDDLLPPHPIYRDMFMPVPDSADITMQDGRWIATYPNGQKARIPGAFADWPVDDSQPPWGDVTYLRLYDHADFNYIAYNTIRMYDNRFAQAKNAVTPLWEYIQNIVPHYQNEFGIDGAMIDMGHALPSSLKQNIIETARDNNSNFAFWDENFKARQSSVDEGYNAVMGGLPFVLYNASDFQRTLNNLMESNSPIAMFGAAENHNTPRAVSKTGSTNYSRFAAAVVSFLPTLPFIHCGMEFGEPNPVNTGLGFSLEEIKQFPSETLALFSSTAYGWDVGDPNLAGWWRKCLELRAQHRELFTDLSAETISPLGSNNPHVQGILRRTPNWSIKIALIYNSNFTTSESVWMPLPTGRDKVMDHFSGRLIEISNSWIHVQLDPGQCWWLEL